MNEIKEKITVKDFIKPIHIPAYFRVVINGEYYYRVKPLQNWLNRKMEFKEKRIAQLKHQIKLFTEGEE